MQPAFPVLASIVDGRWSQDPMVSVAVPLTGPGSHSERPAWRGAALAHHLLKHRRQGRTAEEGGAQGEERGGVSQRR